MKLSGLFSLVFLLSQVSFAGDVNLLPGDSVTIGNTVVSCGRGGGPSKGCDASENPYLVCLNKGYSPGTCKALKDGCAAGQALCLEKGYSPSTCAANIGQPAPVGRCNAATENPYIVCLNKGYSPGTCKDLKDGCAAGQALCLEKGYSPSTCAANIGQPAPGRCDASENPYAVCLNKGYSPGTCKVLKDGCSAGQALCLNKGYSPGTCATQ